MNSKKNTEDLWCGPKSPRKIFAGAVWLLGLIFAAGCGRMYGPEIVITWKSEKPGLDSNVAVKYESIAVGRVSKVISTPDGPTVYARLENKYAHYVRSKSTFLFHPASAERHAFIEVRPLDKDAPPALDGAHFEGAESSLAAEISAIVTDWKKTGLFCAIGVGVVFVLLVAVKAVMKLWVTAICIAGGAICTYYFATGAAGYLARFFSPEIRVDLIAYVATFVGGCLLASLVCGAILRPIRLRR